MNNTITHPNASPATTGQVSNSDLALRFGRSKKVLAVSSREDAVAKWEAFRDSGNYGASECPPVFIINVETGRNVARVHYNGSLEECAY